MIRRYFWRTWLGAGVAGEVVAMKTDALPLLTTEMRGRVLGDPAGSAVTGGFLAWMVYHFGFDNEDLGIEDIAAVLVGAGVGLAGWKVRQIAKGAS